jgi:hypothetical protein
LKTVIVSLVFGVLIVASFFLVLMNRASEKIVTAVIPITVAAITGITLSVFFFGSEDATIEEVFPASVMYHTDTKLPAELPSFLLNRRSRSFFWLPGKLFEQHPEFFRDKDDQTGTALNHHLLQKALVDWLGTLYRSNWQSEIVSFESAGARTMMYGPSGSAPEPSKILDTSDIAKLLEGNKFAGIETGIPPQIALPPFAKLLITPPRPGAAGVIEMRDRFCTISIRTQESSWAGSIGAYKQLAGLSEDDVKQFGIATYLVRFKAEFSRWLSGHPQMPKYKRWASQMVKEMRTQFDEQMLWEAAKTDYRFIKDMGIPAGPRLYPGTETRK